MATQHSTQGTNSTKYLDSKAPKIMKKNILKYANKAVAINKMRIFS